MCMIGRPSKLIHVLIFKPTCNILTFHILGRRFTCVNFKHVRFNPTIHMYSVKQKFINQFSKTKKNIIYWLLFSNIFKRMNLH